jgi:hypothetical protein
VKIYSKNGFSSFFFKPWLNGKSEKLCMKIKKKISEQKIGEIRKIGEILNSVNKINIEVKIRIKKRIF